MCKIVIGQTFQSFSVKYARDNDGYSQKRKESQSNRKSCNGEREVEVALSQARILS